MMHGWILECRATADGRSGEGRPRVLVVEEPPVGRFLGRFLSRLGYEATLAWGGVEGALLTQGFDAVVSDDSARGIDGVALLRRVRESDPDVPVLVLSARPDATRLELAVQGGAFIYLAKPFDNGAFAQVLACAVARHHFARRQRFAREHGAEWTGREASAPS
jgi:DNA-binding response OmpR family regulator